NYPEHHLPELLAPAGSIEYLKAAVLAGADAVYFGGTRFGARAFARNFNRDTVIEAIDYLHFHDRRGYMTVNTLIKEKELQNDLYAYLLPFYKAGLDGVIVQDPGAASFIHEHFPDMEIHGSTQMMITGISGALAAKKMGMNRIVPARELSREELMAIKDATGLELEIFIHGALCYAYSGQCLLSSTYGGRSGNRGRCAQPCRLPYRAYDASGRLMEEEERHLLSPRDLYSLTTLPAIISSGVDSLKVEGRMKNVEYVAGVISVYRRYLDLYASGQPYRVKEEDLKTLEELYVRTAFTEGYWSKHNGPDMMSVDTPRHVGRKLGKISAIRKNRLCLELTGRVSPKDLLIIPGRGEEELALTVPGNLESVLTKTNSAWKLILNAPKTPWLRPGMTVYRRHKERLSREIEEKVLKRQIRYPVEGEMTLQEDEPIFLHLSSRGREVRIEGPKATAALNRPVTEEDIFRQMGKTGDLPFTLKNLPLNIEGNLFVPASALKDFRRKAYDRLEKDYTDRFRRKVTETRSEADIYQDTYT
ncbi:MAG: U32 family peptidase, partial [Eubacterium sp.]|nr:U32 family peptidase [Eubacterium sp.]